MTLLIACEACGSFNINLSKLSLLCIGNYYYVSSLQLCETPNVNDVSKLCLNLFSCGAHNRVFASTPGNNYADHSGLIRIIHTTTRLLITVVRISLQMLQHSE